MISGFLRVQSWKKNIREKNESSLRDIGLDCLMKLKKIWNLWDFTCLMGLFVAEKYEFEWWRQKMFCYGGWTWCRCRLEDEHDEYFWDEQWWMNMMEISTMNSGEERNRDIIDLNQR